MARTASVRQDVQTVSVARLVGSGLDPNQIGQVIGILAEAYDCAVALEKDVWEFALEVWALRDLGSVDTFLRWLINTGRVAHAVESSRQSEGRRTFCPVRNLSIPDGTCFILTPAGREFARRNSVDPPHVLPAPAITPVWDRSRRELRVCEIVVKRYRQPAKAQELVLLTFEEEGWPARIDDPLPPQSGIDSKRRLHTTITNLNRFQKQRLIHFEGGGDGESVCWHVPSVDGLGRSSSAGRASVTLGGNTCPDNARAGSSYENIDKANV